MTVPTPLPPALIESLAAALREEREAEAALAAARAAFRGAVRRTTAAAQALRETGALFTAIASVVARALGVAPSVEARRRIAARFRRRLARARVTSGHAEVASPSASAVTVPVPLSETTEDSMGHTLLKRTTVTEVFEEDATTAKKARAADPRDEEVESMLDDLGGVDDDEDEDDRPQRRRRKS